MILSMGLVTVNHLDIGSMYQFRNAITIGSVTISKEVYVYRVGLKRAVDAVLY
jgi:hypothetical protein